jgi:WD40 repeat protein
MLLDEITAVSVATGDVISVPCEGCDERFSGCSCSPIVPFGDSRIAWLDADNRLVWADLAEETPTVQTTETVVPTAPEAFEDAPLLVAGTDGLALAGYPRELWDVSPIYLVPFEGEPRRLDGIRPDSVETAVFSPDGSQLAITGQDSYSCTTVTVLDVASEQGETSPVSAESGAVCETKDVYITSMWWDPDGTLNVYVQPDDSAGGENVHRRLEDGQWTDAAEDADMATYRFGSGATVAVSSANADGDETLDRVLEFAFEGDSGRIDHSVSSVVVAPPGAADHR